MRNNKERITNNQAAVTAALQSYADRGVFRGFRATPARGGRIDYEFVWLTGKRVAAAFDPRTHTLKFPAIFPRVDKRTAEDLKAVIAGRGDRNQPAHKRLDARRAKITISIREGEVWLASQIRGRNHEYAVKTTLNLINDMFVMLQEHHPDYLIHEFGLSTE